MSSATPAALSLVFTLQRAAGAEEDMEMLGCRPHRVVEYRRVRASPRAETVGTWESRPDLAGEHLPPGKPPHLRASSKMRWSAQTDELVPLLKVQKD